MGVFKAASDGEVRSWPHPLLLPCSVANGRNPFNQGAPPAVRDPTFSPGIDFLSRQGWQCQHWRDQPGVYFISFTQAPAFVSQFPSTALQSC